MRFDEESKSRIFFEGWDGVGMGVEEGMPVKLWKLTE